MWRVIRVIHWCMHSLSGPSIECNTKSHRFIEPIISIFCCCCRKCLRQHNYCWDLSIKIAKILTANSDKGISIYKLKLNETKKWFCFYCSKAFQSDLCVYCAFVRHRCLQGSTHTFTQRKAKPKKSGSKIFTQQHS